MQNLGELKVWQKSHQLTLSIYKITKAFPKEEQYGLTAQLRRGSASIGANIAEGCGREGSAEMARFLQIAFASAGEVEYHLLLAKDPGLISAGEHAALTASAVEIKRMLASLLKKLRAR